MNNYTITPNELYSQLKTHADTIQLVDVRTLDKHQAFNIGGLHIPLENLSERLAELDSSKTIVTYCTMGGKSMHAVYALIDAGFEKVKSLEGGMTLWREMNL